MSENWYINVDLDTGVPLLNCGSVLNFIICLFGFTALFYALIIIAFYFVGKHGFIQTKPSRGWFSNNRRSFFTM